MRAGEPHGESHGDTRDGEIAARSTPGERDASELALDPADLGARTGRIPVFTEHRAGPASAFDTDLPPAVQQQPYDPEEAWAVGPDGQRMWGKHGAAGILAVDRERGVFLQLRAHWSHYGGTWGIPGGALERGEAPVEGALREADEETALESDALDPLFTRVLDLGFWRYTTVAAIVNRYVEPRVIDGESAGVAWVQPDELQRLKLHPAFADAWPALHDLIRHRPALVIDVANVLGARGDGWWRDPAEAATRLLQRIADLATEGLPGAMFGLDVETTWPDVLAVLEGRGRGALLPRDARGLVPRRLAVVRAPGSGDDELVAQVADVVATTPGRPMLVATSDRQLRNRVAELGVGTLGGGRMRDLLEPEERA